MIFSICKQKDWVSREMNFTLKNAILFENAHLLAFFLIESKNSKYESWYDNKLKKLIKTAYDLTPFIQKYIFLPKKFYLSFPKIMNKVWGWSNYLNHLDWNHIWLHEVGVCNPSPTEVMGLYSLNGHHSFVLLFLPCFLPLTLLLGPKIINKN